ncbi:hypothetical protein BCR43DRAFT_16420 [Syncephalastrum racemosum]|uniref:Uncharacterized protein n=1 Tax=Syncephalastrum racemosum TaxID=13706 RepID=A0A1X2HSV4_SYNRA|nr:hypothetical protein BCR43DRAFT_16420 [Syncephalastrum racemosum]
MSFTLLDWRRLVQIDSESQNPVEMASAFRHLTDEQWKKLQEIYDSRYPTDNLNKTKNMPTTCSTPIPVDSEHSEPHKKSHTVANEGVLLYDTRQENSHKMKERRILLSKVIHEMTTDFDMDIVVLFAPRRETLDSKIDCPITSSGTVANQAIWSLDMSEAFKKECKCT